MTRVVAVLVVVATQFAVALFPFMFDPPRTVRNDVRFLADGLLVTGSYNRAMTAGSPAWLPEAITDGRIAIDLHIRPRNLVSGPGSILALSAQDGQADLAVDQDGSDLVVRLRRAESSPRSEPSWIVPGAFVDQQWRRIRIAIDRRYLIIAVEEQVHVQRDLPTVPADSWNLGSSLSIGDEPNGGRTWSGEIRRAEVRTVTSSVDYAVPGALAVPATFDYVTHRDWEPLRWPNTYDFYIGLFHLACFVPLGVVLRRLPGLSGDHFRVVPAAAVLALLIQLTKLLFAARHPALVDVAWMSAGALIGSAAVTVIRRLRNARVRQVADGGMR